MHPGGIEGGEFIFGVEMNVGVAEFTKKMVLCHCKVYFYVNFNFAVKVLVTQISNRSTNMQTTQFEVALSIYAVQLVYKQLLYKKNLVWKNCL